MRDKYTSKRGHSNFHLCLKHLYDFKPVHQYFSAEYRISHNFFSLINRMMNTHTKKKTAYHLMQLLNRGSQYMRSYYMGKKVYTLYQVWIPCKRVLPRGWDQCTRKLIHDWISKGWGCCQTIGATRRLIYLTHV